MKKLLATAAFLLLFFQFPPAQDLIKDVRRGEYTPSESAPNSISQWLSQQKAAQPPGKTIRLLDLVDAPPEKTFDEYVSDPIFLTLDLQAASELLQSKPGLITLNIPVSEKAAITLELAQVNIHSPGFRVTTSDGSIKKSGYALFYRGTILGDPNSLAAVSLFRDQLRVMISDDNGNYVLGKVEEKSRNLHIFYNDADLLAKNPFQCSVEDMVTEEEIPHSRPDAKQQMVNCVDVYIECDYDLYQNKGSGTASYVQGLFNEVAILYQNENITVRISEIAIWTNTDPFAGEESTEDLLPAFRDARESSGFNGDLAHFLSTRSIGGGIAYVPGLCQSWPYAVSGINTFFEDFPTYSWTVNVFAHEMGHNFGSGHTHDCSWNDNNTQIDDCGNIYLEDIDEEPMPCYDSGTPILPSNGGTIMSYCHLINSVLVNFNEGFGQQPGDVMRDRYNNPPSDCDLSCGSAGSYCEATENLTGLSGSFSDGSGTNEYLNNTDCRWLIQPTGVSCIELTFTSFFTESGFDYVYVYDGSTTSAPLLGQFAGSSLPPTLTSSGGSMLVVFQTDESVTYPGWSASYEVPPECQPSGCEGFQTLTDTFGFISDGSGGSNYLNNTNCQWLIQPPGVSCIELFFTSFETESNYDYVYVYDGDDTTDPLLGIFDGTDLPPVVTSSGGSMLVVFLTDGSVTRAGWNAFYGEAENCLEPFCESFQTLTGTSGSFSDGSGSSDYRNDTECTWLIQPPEASCIELAFTSFQTETGFDFLIAYDGDSFSDPVLLVHDGSLSPPPVVSSGGSMLISFFTDGSVTNAGWSAEYTSGSAGISPTAPNTRTFGGSPTLPLYEAKQTITSTSIINSPYDVIFRAGESVTLMPGFHAHIGSRFTAQVAGDGCPFNQAIAESNEGIPEPPAVVQENRNLRPTPLRCIPNPFTGQTTVRFGLAEEQDVLVQIFSSSGQPVAVLHKGTTLAAGGHQFTFDGTSLPGGVYWVIVRGQSANMQERVVLVR